MNNLMISTASIKTSNVVRMRQNNMIGATIFISLNVHSMILAIVTDTTFAYSQLANYQLFLDKGP